MEDKPRNLEEPRKLSLSKIDPPVGHGPSLKGFEQETEAGQAGGRK